LSSLVAIIAIGAVVAGFVQGLSGFAFSLVAMSFWAWTVEPKLAAALSVFGALTGQVISAVTVRRGFRLPILLPYLLGGVVGIPIGIAILPRLDVEMFKALLGALLVVFSPLMLLAPGLPPVTWGGRIADGLAGLLGGICGGIGGVSGPIPTLWCNLRPLDKDTQRSVVQNFNLSTLAFTMAAYLANGLITREMWPMFAIVAPAMLIPTLLGGRLYVGLSEGMFRRIVLTLLGLSGVALLASSLPHLIGRG
jgi:uncharacterized membrane protein YfcA